MEIFLDDRGVVLFRGALVASTIDSAYGSLENILENTGRNISVDLSGVEEIDISGLQLLCSLKKTFAVDGSMRIVSMSPQESSLRLSVKYNIRHRR